VIAARLGCPGDDGAAGDDSDALPHVVAAAAAAAGTLEHRWHFHNFHMRRRRRWWRDVVAVANNIEVCEVGNVVDGAEVVESSLGGC